MSLFSQGLVSNQIIHHFSFSFVLIMEIIGPKHRELIGILYQIPFNVGHASLAVFSYFIRTWRWFQFSITIFSVVFLIYLCTIPESPRWLLTTGKTESAITILEKIAKFNRSPTESIKPEIEAYAKVIAERHPAKKGTVFDLFRTPFLRWKTICMTIIWIVVCLVYYGTAQYISKLGGDIFLNNLIAAALGIPGTLICILLTKYLGRKLSMIITNALSGIALLVLCFCLLFDMETIQIICAIVGLFGASMTFPNAYLWGGETFPTVVRSNGMGLCSMLGRVGGLLAPLICDLAHIKVWITPLIFGIASIIAVFAATYLPETKGLPLPEDLEDGENFGKKK